ncbi:histidine kinase/DNA gyrase B/HSP90-like ATPase [Thiogranum longum]|uniref:histidine kinase n=1 Tax=Thiogranum longum TaxID=1537524 RepID=A0A4R1HNB6_9GAMM|nr:HAMP domain-containing sensor histidine kinase [Thiogranum longum]TCK18752.1 histidine kinase/DNA gyrase B/HSP90-like ATPase [Thiogranum longum]
MSDDTGKPDFNIILANAVHDMKNSVGMLLAALDEIDSRCSPDSCASRDQFSQLRYEGKRLSSNLVQVLTLYRINESRYTPNITENDASDVLEECLLDNEGLLALKGIDIEMDCNDDLQGFFDNELVSGLISSVINNAYKYARSRIHIGAGRENGYLTLYVKDDGNGFPPSMLHEQGQGTPAISFRSGSTGLGLYFAATIAALHRHDDRQGFFTTGNDGINGGGRFTLYLP